VSRSSGAAARPSTSVLIEDDGWRKAGSNLASAVKRAAKLALARGKVSGRLQAGLTVLLTSDARIRALNKQHRGKDKATNVLSFQPAAGISYLGDIAVAYGTALREAEAAGTPLLDHSVHLVIHGVLHLLGYDHEESRAAEIMESLEAEILAQMGISNPYKRRTRAA
jgi:probable rRNA maturation factor